MRYELKHRLYNTSRVILTLELFGFVFILSNDVISLYSHKETSAEIYLNKVNEIGHKLLDKELKVLNLFPEYFDSVYALSE